jgi:D-aminopeptidase
MAESVHRHAASPRARDLGVPFDGVPSEHNAITDVAGVEVGHVTLIEGDGPLVVGKGPVRTGVTAVLPRGKHDPAPCYAAWFSLNGNGEMTGTTWIDESGLLDGPVLLTNTHSVGVVRDAVVEWSLRHRPGVQWSLPVVAETWDGRLSDINGFHVRREHVFAALDGAAGGPVAEGNVGGGTGMIVYDFKGGIGTASRRLSGDGGGYSVGVLVQANHGGRDLLRIAGAPVGREIADLLPGPHPHPRKGDHAQERAHAARDDSRGASGGGGRDGSIIIVVATDAPLLPHQLRRLVKRAALGLARTGSIASHTSGDIFVAFSTANTPPAGDAAVTGVNTLNDARLTPLFRATVEATEEAIVNAMVAARTMTGINGYTVHAIPHDRLRDVLRKYNRLVQ